MKPKNVKNKKSPIYELISTLVIALVLAGAIRTILFQPFWIPTGSMKPNLLVGDFLFVNKSVQSGIEFCFLSLKEVTL